ncbi:inositol transporter 4-like isoform X3 [Cucurbita moschata]|uniref:Inositol transporter 4-like isoform X3 n=1 Tax=Cucurbita moschata TaxID=3662 RepID=A0A6J1GT03_CUCMO|nr:inositol transporter 4-like isoform X3 [Cucurbita moschata]
MTAVGIAVGGSKKEYPGNLTLYVTLTCVVAAMGGLIFGYDIGISGGVTSMDSFLRKFFPSVFRKKHENQTTNQYCQYDSVTLTLFTSSLYLAALLSSLVASTVTRKFGRKLSMLFGGVLFCAGAIINAAAKNVEMLIIGRILLGFGIGFANQDPKQMSSPFKVTRGEVTMIKSGKEGSVMLQYLLLTKSNYTAWLIKMRVNLQAQGVWDVIEHGDIEESKDRMAFAAIYQAVPEDILLMLAEKDSAKAMWETLQKMHVCVKEAKVQTLKSEFEAIRMKNGESIDDFSMKLTIIVSGIRSIGDMVEEIFVVKKFLRAVPSRFMQIVTSIEQFGDLKNMSVEEVVGRLKVHEERLRGYEDKEEEKHLLLTHEEWLARTKKNDVADSFFSSTRGRDSHNNENKGRERSRGHGRGRGGRGGRGNTSQTYDNVNPWKDKKYD